MSADNFPSLDPNQVANIPGRISDILYNLHLGYGRDGRGPNEHAVALAQLSIGELLKDLDIDLSSKTEIVDDRWIFDDLPDYALLPIPAIATAPNLARNEKTEILAQYPSLLRSYHFAWTLRGAKTKVMNKLVTIDRGSVGAKHEQEKLIKQVKKEWSPFSQRKIASFLGRLVSKPGTH